MYKNICLPVILLFLSNFIWTMGPDLGFVETIQEQASLKRLENIVNLKKRVAHLVKSEVELDNEIFIETFCGIACYDELNETLHKLLNIGIDANIGYGDCTALCNAIEFQSFKNAKLLLQYRANPDLATKKGITPLKLAVIKGQKEMVKLLLEYKANINVQDHNKNTVLMEVIAGIGIHSQEIRKQLVAMLLGAGADFRVKNKDGDTALGIARKKQNQDLVDLILRKFTLVDICLGVIDKNKKNFKKAAFNILPIELKEVLNDRIPGLIGLTCLQSNLGEGDEDQTCLCNICKRYPYSQINCEQSELLKH